jgi:hypothetical protein
LIEHARTLLEIGHRTGDIALVEEAFEVSAVRRQGIGLA